MKSKAFAALLFIVIVSVSLIIYSCTEDEDDIVNNITTTELDGQWQFTISPLNDFIDTTTLKGKNGNDFISDPSINDEIYLYETSNQVIGFTGPFEMRGSKTDSIRLEIFEPLDGRYGVDTAMMKSSEMTLGQNSMGFLEGTGKIVLDRDTTGVSNDVFKIFGRKIANISQDRIKNLRIITKSSWLDKLCKVVSDGISFVISIVTDGVFRPMANCWGNKNGGGYYVFGDKGPGSLFPVWTQTAYYPMEWSWCKVRRYDFDIYYDGAVISLPDLRDLVKAQASWLSKIGFHSDSVIVADLDEFYNIYGNFGITFAYNLETKNAAIYANVENGSTSAHSHVLVKTIVDALNPLFNTVYSSSGRSIHDEWHMRRSDFFVCNTPIIFCYIFGTANVKYD